MSEGFVTRLYKEGDEDQIVSILDSSFKKWPFFDISCTRVEHWKWRYLDNPLTKSMVFVIEEGDRIIASGHHALYYVRIKGKNYLSSYGTDYCVHPDFQGLGLSKNLTNFFLEQRDGAGIEFQYMVSTNPRIIESSARKRGAPYEFPYPVFYLTRVEDVNKHIRAQKVDNALGMKLRHYFNGRLIPDPKKIYADLKIVDINFFDSRVDYLLEDVSRNHDFILYRNHDYLNWRYCDPRGGDYILKVAESDNKVIGYIVLRINKLESYYHGYIVELVNCHSRMDVAEALLNSSLQFFKENEVNAVSYQVIRGHPHEALFAKYGFSGGEGERKVFYNYTGLEKVTFESFPRSRVYFSFGALTGI